VDALRELLQQRSDGRAARIGTSQRFPHSPVRMTSEHAAA
jgi:hypothetical protein